MQSKFLINTADHFKGTPVEEAFKTLLELGWKKDEFALAGSSALHFMSTTSISRGGASFINRQPHDIDIIVMGDAKLHAREHGIVTPSHLGRGELISLQLAENKGDLLDITTDWPISHRIKTLKDLKNATVEIDGIQVLDPMYVVELKTAFQRLKDAPDVETVLRAQHLNRPATRTSRSPKL